MDGIGEEEKHLLRPLLLLFPHGYEKSKREGYLQMGCEWREVTGVPLLQDIFNSFLHRAVCHQMRFGRGIHATQCRAPSIQARHGIVFMSSSSIGKFGWVCHLAV